MKCECWDYDYSESVDYLICDCQKHISSYNKTFILCRHMHKDDYFEFKC